MARVKGGKRRKPMMVTHKNQKKRELRAWMQWLLDFLNTDIDSLNPVELLKLFLDFGAFVSADSSFEQFAEMEIKPGKGLTQERKFLRLSQNILRGMLEKILMAEKQIGEESHFRRVEVDNYVIDYFVCVTKDRVLKFPVPFVAVYGSYEEVETLHIGMNNQQTEEFDKKIWTGLLADALIRVITRFPLSRIKSCEKPDCGNYFYQKTTKSKGDFCSRKCQNWARTTRWRKGNPDKYNFYHRNRRAKAKEPWVKITCIKCGHEYPKGHPDPGKCSGCGGKLKYEVQFIEGREWKSEDCPNFNEAEKLRKEILEFERNEGRGTNGKR